MQTFRTSSKLLASLAALLLSGAAAHAQLELSGSTYGVFSDPVGGMSNVISNSMPTSTFTTGNVMGKVSAANPHTSVKFSGDSGATGFDLTGDGDQDSFGKITITNGMDLMKSTATGVTMELFANFTSIGLNNFDLGTLTFTFINTPDGTVPGGVPDTYIVTAGPLASFTHDGVKVGFTLMNTDTVNSFFDASGRAINEKKLASENLILGVTEFSIVPEPSTYALWGCALLGCAVLFRRRTLTAFPSV